MQFDFDFTSQPAPQPDPEPEPTPAPEPATPKILTVSELTRSIRGLLEDRIGQVWVEGEISNHRRQASGHHYFTLKDGSSQLSCVLFAGQASQLKGLRLGDGLSIQVYGEVTVYEARGQYQMIVRLIQHQGEGALQAKFEALKRKLADEGLFAQERKRPLPKFPRSVGVVTSPTGAALRDFLHVLKRRHPGIEILIHPVRVQGQGACREIAQAIREFSDCAAHGLPPIDLMVVTRGGGSIEDLWEFNEEIVARAIAESTVPVLSAIGHEIDFTITDFVADLRAPTPSAAAEILSADRQEVLNALRQDARALEFAVRNRLDLLSAKLRSLVLAPGFREPERRLTEFWQTVDQSSEAMERHVTSRIERHQHALRHLSLQIEGHSPAKLLERTMLRLAWMEQKLTEGIERELLARQNKLRREADVLAALNPEKTLARGYTITLDASGKPITSAQSVQPADRLTTRFADGEVESIVPQD